MNDRRRSIAQAEPRAKGRYGRTSYTPGTFNSRQLQGVVVQVDKKSDALDAAVTNQGAAWLAGGAAGRGRRSAVAPGAAARVTWRSAACATSCYRLGGQGRRARAATAERAPRPAPRARCSGRCQGQVTELWY